MIVTTVHLEGRYQFMDVNEIVHISLIYLHNRCDEAGYVLGRILSSKDETTSNASSTSNASQSR